jgi:hypothetical protein
MIESIYVHLDCGEKEIIVIGLPITSLIRPISVAEEMIESIVEVEICAISDFNRVWSDIFLRGAAIDESIG